MDKELFAGYKKEVEATVVTTTHRVRLRLGSSARDISSALEHVPPSCTLIDVIGDDDHDKFDACGELVFKEEREV